MASGDFRGTGRFAVESRIGSGGFGVVYAARDVKNGSLVALKTLHHLTPETLYRFKREFRSLAGITHPNLVQLYELVSDSDEWFFTMELVEGENFLQHVWRRTQEAEEIPSTTRAHSPSTDVTEPALMPDGAAARPTLPDTALAITTCPADLERLIPALRQLVEGVATLHRAGSIHRDLKPSNILVTPTGRVVLLDFGLLMDIESETTLQSLQIAGTPAYMSPEQAAGLPLSWASDWYSTGVILYQALAGQLPFTATSYLDLMSMKQGTEPPPPSRLVSGVPEHLDTLCRDLLRRDASARPNGDEILARLEPTGPPVARRSAHRTKPARALFVGRDKQLSALRKAANDAGTGAVTVCLHGISGMGKSALLRAFLDNWRDDHPDAVILSGRCFERESVPYKALDSLIDSMARLLVRMPPQEMATVMPRDLVALTQLFPVLRQLEDKLPSRRRAPLVPDSQELRRRAFAALRELIGRLADRLQTILVVDDVQWGDVDSADLLGEILRSPDAPAVLFVASYRSDEVTTSPFLRAFLAPENERLLNMREVRVEQLGSDEARALAEALLSRRSNTTSAAAAIASEAGGSPFFIDELVRASESESEPGAPALPRGIDSDVRETTIAQMIALRVARLPRDAQELLELIAVNGQPIPANVLKRASRCVAHESSIALLTAEHFIRTRETDEQNEIETYHDRIREAVVRSLAGDARRQHHRTLANAFEASRGADAEILAEHFFAAGDEERAIEYTIEAAQNAERALAFDRAAELLRRVLTLLPEGSPRRVAIGVQLGDALVNAGRGAEAAETFLAIPASGLADRIKFRERAAQQYLYSGHIDEGMAVLREVLQAIGLRMPETFSRTLVEYLLGRLRVRLRGLRWRERAAGSIEPDTLLKIDACWSVAMGLGNVDTLRGAVFQSLNFLWALKAGEIHRVARALALEAAYSAIGGSKTEKRTRRVFDEAERAAERSGTPYAKAFIALSSGIAGQLEGEWRKGVEKTDEAERLLRETCTGVTWEIDSAWFFNLGSRYYCGDLRSIALRCPDLIKDAADRGDLYASTILKAILSHYAKLIEDDPEQAQRDVQEAMTRWSRSGFHIQHMWEFWSSVDIALYQGRGAAAWARVLDTWGALKSSPVLHVQFTRINVTDLRGKAALAAAGSTEIIEERKRLIGEALKAARDLEHERKAWAGAFASMLRAGVAAVEKRKDALALITKAEQEFDVLGMPLHRIVAQRRRGELIGGSEGAALVAGADEWMREQTVRNPERFASFIAP